MLSKTPNRQWAYDIIARYERWGYRDDLTPAAVEIAKNAVAIDQLSTGYLMTDEERSST